MGEGGRDGGERGGRRGEVEIEGGVEEERRRGG